MNTNFQNVFALYADANAYTTALNNILKQAENPNLIPDATNTNPDVNPGAWQYNPTPSGKTLWTIGYGYDFSTKNGQQIISDINTVNNALATAIQTQNQLAARGSFRPAELYDSQQCQPIKSY